jgi:hypothetical protein
MKVAPKPRKRKLVESWDSVNESNLDFKNGIVKNVKVIGFTSKHGRTYSAKALREAVSMYEGVRVNIDHPTRVDVDRQSRSYADRFGHLKNARFVEGKGIFADLHYNKAHRLAKQFEWDAKNEPKNLGLSHYAFGDPVRRGGKSIIESITSVQSVDLVADPGTTNGLFESQKTVGGKPRVRKRPKWQALMESLGMELGEAPTPREAIAKLMESIMLDGSLTPAKRKEKILKCLEMDVEDKKPNSRVEESAPMEKKPASKTPSRAVREAKKALREAAKLRVELATRKRRDRVRRLCESMSFKPSKTQLKAIAAMDSRVEAKALIEGFIGTKRVKSKSGTKSGFSNKPKSRAGGDKPAKPLTEAELDLFIDGIME